VPILRTFLIVFALFGCGAAWPAGAVAEPGTAPGTAQAPTPDQSAMRPMVFYVAHGPPNSCGDGCSEWIAADGKIDADSADRLRHLLKQIQGAKPPIFFHSPGGLVRGSIELGRLLRAQKMTVSVGHTSPVNCFASPAVKQSCAEQMSDRLQVDARFDPLIAMCNSACVYAFAGGAVRLIPPGVTLGIHDVSLDPRFPHSEKIEQLAERQASISLHGYLRQMGIDAELLTEAFAIPHTTIGRLSRDDAASFGLDRRDFAETPWFYVDKPSPSIKKVFFARTTAEHPHYIDAVVNLACVKVAGVNRYVLSYGRERLPTDKPAQTFVPPVTLVLNERRIPFAPVSNEKLYVRSAVISADVMDGIAAGTIVLPGPEFGREQESAGDIALTMTGFSALYATLRDACVQPRPARSAAQDLGLSVPVTLPPPALPPAVWPATQPIHPLPQGGTAQQSCAARVPDVAEHVTGRVTGFATEQQVSETTRNVEAQVGAKESPAYLPLKRAVVKASWQNRDLQTMAAIPENMTVHIGDKVELNSRHRDPSLPCNFIPWTISQIAEHAK
jgi:hypothetical protein